MSLSGIDANPSAIAWLLVKVSAVVAAAAALQLWRRNSASAAARHLTWSIAAGALLVLPLLSAALPDWTVGIPVGRNPTVTSPAAQQPDAVAGASERGSAPYARASGASTYAAVAQDGRSPRVWRDMPDWPAALLLLYAAGTIVLGLRLALQHVAAHRLAGAARAVTDAEWLQLLQQCARHMGIRHAPSLLRTQEGAMPMAFGIRRPAILIPAVADTWPEDRRRAVLLHELAHVARRDCLTQLLGAAACALYWVHPGVWWVARRLRVERELACDDRVLAAGTEARSYAGHLLEIAYTMGGHRAPALAVTMARPGQLEGRMLAVLDAARNRATPSRRIQAAMIVLAAVLLVPLARARATVLPIASGENADLLAPRAIAATPRVPLPSPASPAAAAAAMLQSPPSPGAQAARGTWQIQSKESGRVYLEMREDHSSSGTTVPLDRLEGLSAAQIQGSGGVVRFAIRRDAGTFSFEGTFRNGVGGGTYAFNPNQAFPGELERRGIARPSVDEQYELARHDVSLAFVDELVAQGYQKPPVGELVRAGQHGVGLEFLRGMGSLGYHLGSLEPLIKMRDHGVTPEFVRELTAQGLPRLSADDLVRTRDHGVTPQYVRELRDLGYAGVDVEQLVNTRDHGVTPEYVRELAALGYAKLPLAEIVNARDHGITPGYAGELRDQGYRLSLAEMIRARDHGVTGDYVRDLTALGYRGLPLERLVAARDHGVTPEYVKELKSLGYQELAIEEVISLRDHGATADKIRRANERAGTRLPPDMLKRLNY